MHMPEKVIRQPYRLAHFSLHQGTAFLHDRIAQQNARMRTFSSDEQIAEGTSYRSQFNAADRFITYTIATAFPHRRNTADLLNETALLEPNSERALRYIDGTVEPRLKFEVIRKLLLAGISKDIDDRSQVFQMRAELNTVQELLDRELFTGRMGQTWPTTTYTIHDNKTNLVLGVHDVYPVLVKPGTHVKRFEQQMRYVGDVGFVLSSVREKTRESSIGKALRDAQRNLQKKGIDTISPLQFIKDSMGLQFVVKGTVNNNEPRINVLREKVLTTLRKQYGDVQIIKRDHKPGQKDEGAQSTEFTSQRIMVQIPGFPIPLELMFFGEADYINNKYHVGRKDRKTKQYPDGAAHSLYEIRRVMDILPVIYPEKVDHVVIPGYIGLKSEAAKTLVEKSESLRRSNKVKVGRRIKERVLSRKKVQIARRNVAESLLQIQ
jgi:hypothetical protein